LLQHCRRALDVRIYELTLCLRHGQHIFEGSALRVIGMPLLE
jgi:hypothetical protein